jgi:hypothetical protein
MMYDVRQSYSRKIFRYSTDVHRTSNIVHKLLFQKTSLTQ